MRPEILIVDDEFDVADLIKSLIEQENFEAFHAPNAEQAQAYLRENQVSLIFCDISMPGRSGLELLHDLRGAGLPAGVVMVTGHNDTDRVIKAMQLGAMDYIVKPFDSEAFSKRLSIWLEMGRRLHDVSKGGKTLTPEQLQAQLRMIELFRLKNFASAS